MNIKIESSNGSFNLILNILLVLFITFMVSNSIIITIVALILSITLHYREKKNGIYFTDDDITILDGVFIKRKRVYDYSKLYEIKIKQVYSTTAYSNVLTLCLEKDFKYTYPTTMTAELMEIKDFARSKGIFVDDDSEKY